MQQLHYESNTELTIAHDIVDTVMPEWNILTKSETTFGSISSHTLRDGFKKSPWAC